MRNRQRRADKRRKGDGRRGRSTRQGRAGPGATEPRGDRPQGGAGPQGGARRDSDLRARLGAAFQACQRAAASGDQARLDQGVALLTALGADVGAMLCDLVVAHVRLGYAHGWQPADLVAVTGRLGAAADLLAASIGEEVARAGWAATDLHPRWRAQLADLGAWPPSTGEGPLARALGSAPEPAVAIADGFRLVDLLGRLPTVPELLAPPGRARTPLEGDTPRGLDAKVLARIRGLLAKAESTTFPEEAEALSAKAQLLMSRHAIDAVAVAAGGDGDERPIGVRLTIDDPYAEAKAMLLHVVARANRCRVVWFADVSLASVVGFESDLTATELLFTSLLVQANRAMLGAAVPAAPDGRRRTTSFRRSFLAAYASRVGQRLTAAAAEAFDEAAERPEGDLLPALVAREHHVERAVEELFPNCTTRGVAVSHRGGWAAGSQAADRADLGLDTRIDGGRGADRSAVGPARVRPGRAT